MSTIEWFVVAVIAAIVVVVIAVSLFKTGKHKDRATEKADRTNETQVMTGRPETPIDRPIRKPLA